MWGFFVILKCFNMKVLFRIENCISEINGAFFFFVIIFRNVKDIVLIVLSFLFFDNIFFLLFAVFSVGGLISFVFLSGV